MFEFAEGQHVVIHDPKNTLHRSFHGELATVAKVEMISSPYAMHRGYHLYTVLVHSTKRREVLVARFLRTDTSHRKTETNYSSLPEEYMANSDGPWHVSDGEWRGKTT